MTIIIRTDTKEPIQQQVYEQIKAQIFNRNLKPGSLIPSIRTLASELQISVITVKNAYDLLQKEGLVYSFPAKGFYISDLSDEEIEKRKLFMLMQATEEMIQNLEPYGIKREDVIQFLHTQEH